MFFGSKQKDEEIATLKARIEQLERQIKGEDTVVNEITEILQKFERGLLDVSVKSVSNNPKLENIKQTLNKALANNANLADMSITTLIEYGKANFNHEVNVDGISGKMGSILLGIRALGSSVSELLALIDITASELNKQIAHMTQSASNLSNEAGIQASRLEETAAALEEVTGAISSTTEHTSIMAKLSEAVNQSAINGQKLANDTFISMDSINAEVSTIDEAITVIDQIAFQTNILSLNAAVEAATAGEAGRGFAVVAGEVRNLANRSAEAAKGIKIIVNNAKNKAESGKQIATNMINGYTTLNENINNQLKIIEDVSNATKEQKQAIEQINDAVNNLGKITQHNAEIASEFSDDSASLQNLSQKLVDVISHTTYRDVAKQQVCNIDLMFELNKLKLDHINFKNGNCKKLHDKTSFKVVTDHECNLGKWIDKQEREGKPYTKTPNWTKLKDVHAKVHSGVQNIIDYNAKDNIQDMLKTTLEIDKAVSEVFWSIQQIKRDNCTK